MHQREIARRNLPGSAVFEMLRYGDLAPAIGGAAGVPIGDAIKGGMVAAGLSLRLKGYTLGRRRSAVQPMIEASRAKA